MLIIINKKKIIAFFFFSIFVVIFVNKFYKEPKKIESDIDFIRSLPIIVVGGFGRSGTTLLRTMLDVHPNIQCGPETKIIPHFLGFMKNYQGDGKIMDDLREAGIEESLINDATVTFIYHILKHRNLRPSTRICLKDPDILYHMEILAKLFPNAKFVYIYRDGRVATFSLMKKLRERLNFKLFIHYLRLWNKYNQLIVNYCHRSDKCFGIKYEQLIDEPETILKGLIKFLGEKWTEKLLEHENHLNMVKISKLEWSSNQIKNSIYKNSSSLDFEKYLDSYDPMTVARIAPMLKIFNYNTS